jgi:beta-galactosidase
MSNQAAAGSTLSHRRPWRTERFWFGVCYYPEHWDEATRAGDAERMSAAGINVVRLAEFAWDLMEPEEGRFDFSLFDQTVATLDRHGIKSMLCTPTASPPRWLTHRHPEVLRVDSRGIRLEHGSRQHACTTNPRFRAYSRAVTQAMAQHFRGNPAVVGWQTDNEFHCHFSECHCPACQTGFRGFLSRRHSTIAALNAAWGNAFWAQGLSSFDEVVTPRDGLPTHQNPSARLDYQRFLSASTEEFQREQIDILRSADPRWFITHNGLYGNIDYRGGFGRDLDVIGRDLYPMFVRDARDRPYDHAVNCDQARCLGGNFIVPEHQAGPGGQPGYLLDTPAPGEMRQLAYATIARGADSLLFFRWRSCRFGAEEYWCGILDHDSVPRRRYRELQQMGREMAQVGAAVLGTSVRVEAAVAWGDFDVNNSHYSYGAGMPGHHVLVNVVHRALMHAGYAVGLIHPEDDLAGVKLYWIPHWEMFRPEWVEPLTRWVESGGTLVVGARSATRDPENRIVAATWPGCLRHLVGATVEEFGRINHPESRPLNLRLAGQQQAAEHWYESLAPDQGTDVIGFWSGQHLDDQPAVTRRQLGLGQVVYVGTWGTQAVVGALLPELTRSAGLEPMPGAQTGIQVVCREGAGKRLWFLFNHRDEVATVTLPEAGRDLLTQEVVSGSMRLQRNGVAVISVAQH